MTEDKHRYFIELQVVAAIDIPRRQEAELRREAAHKFIRDISEWLRDCKKKDDVASIAVTALGQVLITCDQDTMDLIREHENTNIAAVRPAASFSDSLWRIGG